MPEEIHTRRTYLCSFCGRNQHQVERLIAGPNMVYICNECITLCWEIINEKPEGKQIMPDKDVGLPPTPTPCPECKAERMLAEAGNNMRVVGFGSGQLEAISANTGLWALVCPNCGYTSFYAKEPGKLKK